MEWDRKMEIYKTMELSTQIVIEEALKRGIEVDVLDEKDNFIRLKKGDKIEYVKQATKTSLDSYITPLIMENKEVTKIILKEHGIQVPEGIAVASVQQATEHWEQFAARDIVVKPKSTNFGEGVMILKKPYTFDQFEEAVTIALQYDTAVLIEQFIPGKEYRFLVIGDCVVAVLHRIPANVTGDGIQTIADLIEQKNQHPLRGVGHVTPFEKLVLGEVELACLRSQGKDPSYVPQAGETVYIRENSNVSTGGDSIDFTDQIRPEYKQIAIEAVKAVDARICGLDMIIQDITELPDEMNYSIIELNFNPAVYLHNYPYQGENRHVERHILDLLGF